MTVVGANGGPFLIVFNNFPAATTFILAHGAHRRRHDGHDRQGPRGAEVQTVTIGGTPTGGTFTLERPAHQETTGPIVYDASVANLQPRSPPEPRSRR